MHQLGAIAGQELKLATLPADDSDGYFGVVHGKLDFAKRVRSFHGRMFRQKFQRISREECVPARFIAGGRDEKIGQQRVVDPGFDGFAE